MLFPSGDHAGWRASAKSSVIRCAMPPLTGTVHRTPSKSMARVLPSGDNATAIFVPSWIDIATLMVSEGSTEIAATKKIRRVYVNVLNFIEPPGFRSEERRLGNA